MRKIGVWALGLFGFWGAIGGTAALGHAEAGPAMSAAKSTVEAYQQGGLWGLRDSGSGRILLGASLEQIDAFADGVAAAVDRDGIYGYLRPDGTWAIPPRFEDAGDFQDGAARVRLGEGEEGLIDLSGKWLLAPKYRHVSDPSGGHVYAYQEGDSRYYRTADGRPEPWGTFKFATDFDGGRAAVGDESRWWLLDLRGGRTPLPGVTRAQAIGDAWFACKRDGRWGFVGPDGVWKIPPRYDDVLDSEGDRIAVQVGKGQGFVDRAGQWIVQPVFAVASAEGGMLRGKMWTWNLKTGEWYGGEGFTAWQRAWSGVALGALVGLLALFAFAVRALKGALSGKGMGKIAALQKARRAAGAARVLVLGALLFGFALPGNPAECAADAVRFFCRTWFPPWAADSLAGILVIRVLWVAFGVLGAATAWVLYPYEKGMGREVIAENRLLHVGEWLQWWLLRWGSLPLLWAASVVGSFWGPWVGFAGLAGLVLIVQCVYPVLIRWGTSARKLSGERELAAYAAIPADLRSKPELYVFGSEKGGVCNAFATGIPGFGAGIFVSRRLLREAPLEEIRAVLAHELAHVRHKDTLRLFGAWVACAVGWQATVSVSPKLGLGAELAFWLGALLLMLALVRDRERKADARAAAWIGDPASLVAVLERLTRIAMVPDSPGKLGKWFRTHPSLEERRRLLSGAK